jgi:hypothetical protein
MSKLTAEGAMNPARLFLLAVTGGVALVVSAGSIMPAAPVKPEPEKPLQNELLQVAKDYKSWGRVDDEMRWSPTFCRMPEPGKPQFSASKDADTHGQKLYSLFAKDRDAYFMLGAKKSVAVGQVVVKESWVPEEAKDRQPGRTEFKDIVRTPPPEGAPKARPLAHDGDHFYPYAVKDGKVFKASKPAGLFVMMKLFPKTEGTDNGWVYGTISADRKQVTASGKIESCMKCHESAKYDRLFWFAQK